MGMHLVFISHKLHEVMDISNRVTVLRDGRVIGTRQTSEVTRNELVTMMVGRDVRPLTPQPLKAVPFVWKSRSCMPWATGEPKPCAGLICKSTVEKLSDWQVFPAMVSANWLNAWQVFAKPPSGNIAARGDGYHQHAFETSVSIRDLAYIPEERMRDGAIREFSVQENIFLHDHASPRFTHGIFLDFARMKSFANELVAKFSVKTPGLDTPIKNLSGGNIQKLIMARELSRQPKVLIAAQPTRGVDIGATEYIHQRLLQQREEGTAIFLISEDLDEIRVLSDRIAVLYEGRIMGIVDRNQATVEQIGLMMAGISMEEAIQRGANRLLFDYW